MVIPDLSVLQNWISISRNERKEETSQKKKNWRGTSTIKQETKAHNQHWHHFLMVHNLPTKTTFGVVVMFDNNVPCGYLIKQCPF